MNNKNKILDAIEELINVNQFNGSCILKQKVNDILDVCPNDELLAKASTKWNKRSETLEIYWKFDQDYYASYIMGEHKLSWDVVLGKKHYNHQKNGKDQFYSYLQKCIEKYNYLSDYFTGKLLSKNEFCHELILEIHHFIDYIIEHKGMYDGIVLSIDKNSFRPSINNAKDSAVCDIYELRDCINFESLKTSIKKSEQTIDNIKNELVNYKFIKQLGDKYFPKDSVEDIKGIIDKRQKTKITKKEFYEYYNLCIHNYLVEKNEGIRYGLSKKTYNSTKYLGIDIATLKPYVSIIEGLVECDIYDLKKITECYQKSTKGKFLFEESRTNIYGKAIIKDKTLINGLVDYYFKEDNRDASIKLPLIKKGDVNKLSQSDYIQVYIDDWRDVLLDSGVSGKFSDYLWTDRYIEIPQTLLEIFKQYVDDKVKRHKDFEEADKYARRATELKKEKNYSEAIKWYLKCKDLLPNVNVGTSRGMFHDLLICYRMIKDYNNRALIAKEAHENFPEEVEFEKAYLETSFQLPPEVLPPKLYEVENAVNYGELYEKEILLLPEYTFSMKDSPFHKYSEISKRYEWFISDRKYFKLIDGTRKIQNHFVKLIREAQNAEAVGNLDKAVTFYELLLAEGCYRTTPIDRLIVIYSKQHRKEDLKRVLIKSIEHFKNLENRQFNYVYSLAEKYEAVKELEQQLKEKEEIRYWGGDIVLYQKYKKVESWEKRLSKL